VTTETTQATAARVLKMPNYTITVSAATEAAFKYGDKLQQIARALRSGDTPACIAKLRSAVKELRAYAAAAQIADVRGRMLALRLRQYADMLATKTIPSTAIRDDLLRHADELDAEAAAEMDNAARGSDFDLLT
jgi:hypothetical protein